MKLLQHLYVQIARRCNLTCSMCGWKVWARNKGEMPPAIFRRVIEQCIEYEIDSMRFSSAQGEPMLNPHWADYGATAIAAGLQLNINTNCTPLSEKNIAKLRELALTKRFTIQCSFAGHDKASYEQVYVGSDFELTSQKLKALWGAIGELRDHSDQPVFTIRGVVYDHATEQKSCDHLRALGINLDHVLFVLPDNFAGRVANIRVHPVGVHKPLCYILTDQIGVYDDGTVTACASRDSEGVMQLGNIMTNSLLELRNSSAYLNMVQAFTDQNFENSPLCKNCDIPYGGA